MPKIDNKGTAEGLYKKNASINTLFFTNDGQCFERENHAQLHQKEINGDIGDIEKITREDVADFKDPEKAKQKIQKEIDKLKSKKADQQAKLDAETDDKKKLKISTSLGDIDVKIAELEAQIV